MIRPAHLIRRTALIVANLTPDPILGLTAKAVCWHDDLCSRLADRLARRWSEYQAGALAAIELTDDNLSTVLDEWSRA